MLSPKENIKKWYQKDEKQNIPLPPNQPLRSIPYEEQNIAPPRPNNPIGMVPPAEPFHSIPTTQPREDVIKPIEPPQPSPVVEPPKSIPSPPAILEQTTDQSAVPEEAPETSSMDEPNLAGDKYQYLEDDVLEKNFGDFMNTHGQEYTIHVCIYKINYDTKCPFLEILLEKGQEGYVFPSISNFKCSDNNTEPSSDDEPHPDHTKFMNTCIEKLLSVTHIHDIFGQGMFDEMYKGFIEHDPNTLVVVFDFTGKDRQEEMENPSESITTPIPEQVGGAEEKDQSVYKWAILDEIMNKQKILDTPILPNVSDVFKKYKYMRTIKLHNDQSDTYDDIPQTTILYMCLPPPDSTGYKVVTIGLVTNVNYDNLPENSSESEQTTIEHRLLGTGHLFSLEPLVHRTLDAIDAGLAAADSPEDLAFDLVGQAAVNVGVNKAVKTFLPLARFAGCSNEPLYIIKDLASITSFETEELGDPADVNGLTPQTATCVFFTENKIQYCLLRREDDFSRILQIAGNPIP